MLAHRCQSLGCVLRLAIRNRDTPGGSLSRIENLEYRRTRTGLLGCNPRAIHIVPFSRPDVPVIAQRKIK